MRPPASEISGKPSFDLLDRVLGKACEGIASPVRAAHQAPLRAWGVFDVEIPFGRVGSWIARRLNLPSRGTQIPVELDLDADGESMTWTRRFGDTTIASKISAFDGFLEESFGQSVFRFGLQLEESGIRYRQLAYLHRGRRWPALLAPTITSLALPSDHGWTVDVQVKLPVLGNICHYYGEMALR